MQIIKVKGVNAMGKTDGCEEAPVAVLKDLDEVYSNEKGKIIDKRLFELEEIHLDNSNVEEANQLIYKNAKEIFSEQDKTLFIGGDHSISYSLVKAFFESFEKPFLIVFDAHADCMKPGKEPTHEEWLRAVVERGFPTENIVLVAARNIYSEEKAFLNEKKIRIITMQQIQENRQDVCDLLMESAKDADALYVSVDIDALDPAYAPGTSYLEPGGMSSREMIYFLQRLSLLKNFKAADIVEINPGKDEGGRTVKLGAKLVGEMM